MRIIKITSLLLFISLIAMSSGYCGDLDDGISKFTDDKISKWDDLGKKDINVNFIKLNARSQADVRSKRGKNVDTGAGSGGANMNSVVLGAGGVIRGDVIIIDDSRGDKTQIVE